MKKYLNKWLPSLLAMLLLVMTLVMPVSATSVSVLDGMVTFTDTANNISASGTTVTIKVKANGGYKPASNRVTMTNASGKDGKITFSWSVSNQNSINVDGSTATSGNFEKNIAAGGTVTIILGAKGGLVSPKTATLTLSSVAFEEVASTYPVTITRHGSGTVTVGGSAVDFNGSTSYDVSPTAGAALKATAASGYTFVGWLSGGTLLTTSNPYTVTPSAAMTIQAVFAKNASEAWFYVDGTYLIQGLNEACAKGTKVVLAHNGTLVAGNYTIPGGDTLLIPYDAAHTLCTTSPTIHKSSYVEPTVYRKLTMADGANITVNGALSVSALQSPAMGTNGSPSSAMGVIEMKGSSSITVGNGNGTNGALYVWGYISGSGSVRIKSGSTVYESFQLTDWRGGNGTYSMNGNDEQVFPFSQYYVQNIEVPLTLEAGATESCYMSVAYTGLTGSTEYKGSAVPFIAPSNGMFRLSNGSLTKRYDGTDDRLYVEIDGDIQMANISLKVPAFLGISITIDSENYVLPMNGNLDVTIKEGKTMTVAQDVSFLPGFELTIEKDAKVQFNSGKRLYVYDADQWSYQSTDDSGNAVTKGYVGSENKVIMPLKNVYGRASGVDRATQELKDAVIVVNGTLDASNGYLYTTEGGAAICSDENGIVILKKGTETVTYQGVQKVVDGNQTVEFSSITISTAQLQHGDGTYLTTDSITETTTYRYHETHERWVAGTHTDTAEVTQAADCVLPELSKFTCTCTYVQENVQTGDPLGHTEVTDAAVDPTCTEAGKTEGKHCSVCTVVLVAQETIARTAHAWAAGTEAAGYCDNCTAEFKFTANVAVEEGLDMYFYIDVSDIQGIENPENLLIEVTKTSYDSTGHSGTVTKMKAEWDDSVSGMYRVCFPEIAAKEMMDELTAVVYQKNGDSLTQLSVTHVDSIADYAHRIYQGRKDDLTDKNMALFNAFADMLNYGAYCQKLFGYNADNLANRTDVNTGEVNDWNDGLMDYATKSDLDTADDRTKGTYSYGTSFTAEHKLQYSFYYNFNGAFTDPTQLKPVITITQITKNDDGTTTETVLDLEPTLQWYTRSVNGVQLHAVDIIGIPIYCGDATIKCELYNGEIKAENLVDTTTDNLANYADRVNDAGQTLLYNTSQSLMKFTASARTYFNTK